MITDPGRQVWDEEILDAISKARDVIYTDGFSNRQLCLALKSRWHRPPLAPRKYSWYSFLLETESTIGP